MPTNEDRKAAKEAADRVDWTKLNALTDTEIDAAADADEINPTMSDEERARAYRPIPLAAAE